MSRYRLLPTAAQEAVLQDHCSHARYVWNLALEQHTHWHPGRTNAPGYLEQCRELTAARAEYPWLAGGSQVIGIDRGIAVSAALSTGDLLHVPGLTLREGKRLRRLARILRSGWGILVRRLEQKAPGRVEKIRPAFTSQRCWACGRVDPKSRESQAVFRCTACGYACHADVNAARNIAAGHAVTARGGDGAARPANREPQLLFQSA